VSAFETAIDRRLLPSEELALAARGAQHLSIISRRALEISRGTPI
jgi:hypothetical protein